MVKLEFTGYCKDCLLAELALDRVDLDSCFYEPNTLWSVRCIHEDICDRWNFKKESKQNE